MDEKNTEAIMSLILYGETREKLCHGGCLGCQGGRFCKGRGKAKAAQQSLTLAHHAQTEMLTREAEGNPMEVSLLMVHGQDHLMTGMMFLDLAKELVDVYRRLEEKK